MNDFFKKHINFFSTLSALIPFFAVSQPSFAQYGLTPDSTYGPAPDQTSLDPSVSIFNPLGKASIYDIAQAILDIIMVFAVPIIVFFIIWAGFLYVTAQGKEAQITKATNALLYAVIGGVIVLGANVLLDVIQNTFDVFK